MSLAGSLRAGSDTPILRQSIAFYPEPFTLGRIRFFFLAWMPQVQLPPEILDYIFLHLRDTSDLPTLRACCAVSSFFHQLAEPHLYYQLTLTNGDDPNSELEYGPTEILKAFSARPHAADHVRFVKIDLASRDYSNLRDTVLVPVLQLLQHVESVSLENRLPRDEIWQEPHRWDDMSDEFRDAFLRLLTLPSLRGVSVHDITDFPLQILDAASSLEHLVLVGDFSYEIQMRAPFQHRARLKSLKMGHPDIALAYEYIVAWLLDSPSSPVVSQLEDFKAVIANDTDLRTLSFILSACANSLKVFELDGSPGGKLNSVSLIS